MKVEIALVNTFNTLNPSKQKARTTRDLTVEEAQAMYLFFEKLLCKLEKKDRNYWKEKEKERPAKTFKLALEDVASLFNNSLEDEDWEDDFDWDEEDWEM